MERASALNKREFIGFGILRNMGRAFALAPRFVVERLNPCFGLTWAEEESKGNPRLFWAEVGRFPKDQERREEEGKRSAWAGMKERRIG